MDLAIPYVFIMPRALLILSMYQIAAAVRIVLHLITESSSMISRVWIGFVMLAFLFFPSFGSNCYKYCEFDYLMTVDVFLNGTFACRWDLRPLFCRDVYEKQAMRNFELRDGVCSWEGVCWLQVKQPGELLKSDAGLVSLRPAVRIVLHSTTEANLLLLCSACILTQHCNL